MAVIAQYNLEGASATSVDANATAGDLTNASLDTFVVNDGTLGYASDPIGRAEPANGSTNLANAITNNSYFSFVITPDGGYELDLTSLTFTAARGGASTPRGYSVRSSVDSYAADIQTADLATQRTTWTNVNIDLTGAGYQNLSGITFRFYWYSPNGVFVDFDTIVLNGTVASTSSTSIKTVNGLAKASVKTVNGIAIASVKTVNGLV